MYDKSQDFYIKYGIRLFIYNRNYVNVYTCIAYVKYQFFYLHTCAQ